VTFQLDLTDEDQQWLLNKYQGLSVTQENGVKVVSGALDFWAFHQDIQIRDTYQIRIEFQHSSVSDLPTVSETEGRIKKVAETSGIPISDLHTYTNGVACLCLKLAEASYFPEGFSLPVFMEKLVEPFFYAQRYFEDHDIWPWDAYSHWELGWLEWYFDQKEHTHESTRLFLEKLRGSQAWNRISGELSKKDGVKGHHPCLCGSKKKYRYCHKNVLRGLWELRNNIKAFGLKLKVK
jgi:hypothetical protein